MLVLNRTRRPHRLRSSLRTESWTDSPDRNSGNSASSHTHASNLGSIPLPITPAEVFHRHASHIFTVAWRLLSNYADAEDVTQEVLLGVVRKLALFRGGSELRTWLHRMTINAALQHRRRCAKRKTQTISEYAEQRLPHAARANHSGPTPDKIAIQEETNRLIEEAMSRLPQVCRVVVALSVVEGMPNLEIGKLLGLSLSAVKSRLRRGRLLMRAALAPHLEWAAPVSRVRAVTARC